TQLPKIITNYNDLPEKFREDHFDLSVKLLAMISEGRNSKYEGMKKEHVLTKLNSCIEKPLAFQLNSDAFYLRSGNLKHVKIAEALTRLDIKLTPSLKVIGKRPGGFLCDRFSNIENKGDELFRLVDEIVARRNDIAHGEDIDDILSITGFNEYVDFLEGYGRAVFQTLIERMNKFEAEYLYEKIVNVIDIYRNGSVLCFEIENNRICVGDYIIVNLLDGGFIKKKIIEIRKDDEIFDELLINEPQNIGINIGGGISKGQNFFIKKQII
ncbi:HEPN domain-containing protein, partial [Psychrobacter raelei]|uniref:HEPN domain-containing protein n=1 Tax=Psychrobacter raelei TaxID=2565531 RepID=UPI003F620402